MAPARRALELSDVAMRLSGEQMILIILDGRGNRPRPAINLTPARMDALADFLQSRRERR